MNKKYSSNAGIHYDADAVVVMCKCLTFDNINISTKNDVIDSIEIKKGDIVALGGQTDNSQNGIYVSTGVHLVRHPLFNNETNMLSHIVVVTNGTYKNYRLYISVVGTIINVGLGEIMGSSTGDLIIKNGLDWIADKNAGLLKPGSWYLIPDFVQTYNLHNIVQVFERGIPTVEPMLVFATGTNTYDQSIKSLTYPQDIIIWDADVYNPLDLSYYCPNASYLYYHFEYSGGVPDAGDVVFEFGGTIITIPYNEIPIGVEAIINQSITPQCVVNINNPDDFYISFLTYLGTNRLTLVNHTLTMGGNPITVSFNQLSAPYTEGYPDDYMGVIKYRKDTIRRNEASFDLRHIKTRLFGVTAPTYDGVANVQATGLFTLNDPLVYPSDGDTITIGTDVYEFDSNSAVTPGNIAMPFVETYVPQTTTIEFDTVPDAGTWQINVGINIYTPPYHLAFNADAAAIQTEIRAMDAAFADVTVTGDYVAGFLVTWQNVPKTYNGDGTVTPIIINHNLTTLGVPVTPAVPAFPASPVYVSDSNELVEIIRSTVVNNSALVVPSVTGTDITFTAAPLGTAGNTIATTTTTAFGSFATATLEGGIDEVKPAFNKYDVRVDPTDDIIYICGRTVTESGFPNAEPMIWAPFISNNYFCYNDISQESLSAGGLTITDNYIDLLNISDDISYTGNSIIVEAINMSTGLNVVIGSNNTVRGMLNYIEGSLTDMKEQAFFNIIYASNAITIFSYNNKISTCLLCTVYENVIMSNGRYNNALSSSFISSCSYNTITSGNSIELFGCDHNDIYASANMTLIQCSDIISSNAVNFLLKNCSNWKIEPNTFGTRNENYILENVPNITMEANCSIAGIDFSSAIILFGGATNRTIYYDSTFAEPRIRYMDNGLWVNAAVND